MEEFVLVIVAGLPARTNSGYNRIPYQNKAVYYSVLDMTGYRYRGEYLASLGSLADSLYQNFGEFEKSYCI
jgi:hypothetical protein